MTKLKHNSANKDQSANGTNRKAGRNIDPSDFVTRSNFKALEATVETIRTNQQHHQTFNNKMLALSVVIALLAAAGTIWNAVESHRSARVAEETQRATLAIMTIRMDALRRGLKPPTVIFHVKNVGGGGADVTQESVYQIIANLPPGQMPENLGEHFGGPNRYRTFHATNHIAQDQTGTLMIDWPNAEPITDAEFSDIMSGKRRFFVLLRMRYVSRNEPHVIEFCGFWRPMGIMSDLTNCDRWNTAR